ncbi:MAG: 2-dehydro-3-deoxyphosphogluconate aldolase [Planctomyces sp.]|jgi:2-dehydro-3-deoxyphosphogluconate aldolase/(4S)-4-hydroxy-2-oxoglutarate aldolase|nr:2-dehydro-3-deoxyphosphogluconate aldolase [Planctomyces sp.]
MSRHASIARVLESGLVAILRADSPETLVPLCHGLSAGGIQIIEITMTVPGALDVIRQLNKDLGHKVLVGAGTILDPETARLAILAGAEFLVTPSFNAETIKLANRYDKLILPGILSPTELITALEAGASMVKLFPADAVGPTFLAALTRPFPQAMIVPTGGVTLETLKAFVDAGAAAVGLATSLVDKQLAASGDVEEAQRRAAAFVARYAEVRRK